MRAILGWPLGDPSLNAGCSIMLNILGEADGEEGERRAHELMSKAYLVKGAKVHWYGKPGMRLGRKVGRGLRVQVQSAGSGAMLMLPQWLVMLGL